MSTFFAVGLLVVLLTPLSQVSAGLPDPCQGMGCPGVVERFALLQNFASGPPPAEILDAAVISGVRQFDFMYSVDRLLNHIDATLYNTTGETLVSFRHLSSDPATSPTSYFHVAPGRNNLARIFRFDLTEIFSDGAQCEYTCKLFSRKTILSLVPFVVREATSGMIDGKTFVLRVENSRSSQAVFSISCLTTFLGNCISPVSA